MGFVYKFHADTVVIFISDSGACTESSIEARTSSWSIAMGILSAKCSCATMRIFASDNGFGNVDVETYLENKPGFLP